jgi:hypothetical protein
MEMRGIESRTASMLKKHYTLNHIPIETNRQYIKLQLFSNKPRRILSIKSVNGALIDSHTRLQHPNY